MLFVKNVYLCQRYLLFCQFDIFTLYIDVTNKEEVIMNKKTYHAPATEISVMNPEGGMCQVIEYNSTPGSFDSNRRGGYYEEGDEQWGDLWAEEEE